MNFDMQDHLLSIFCYLTDDCTLTIQLQEIVNFVLYKGLRLCNQMNSRYG